MNTLQRVVILLWICSVVALAARPPWTVHTTSYYSTGHEAPMYATKTVFRWFLAPPEWEIYAPPNESPFSLKFSGTLRFDLLALEVFVASLTTVGLALLTGRRTR